jgi:hypothetical protein
MKYQSLNIRIKAFAIIICLIAGGITKSYSDENEFRANVGRRMLNLYTNSARSTGLGGSYAAINDGGYGIVQNPASLAAQQKHEVINQFSLSRIVDGSKDATVTTLTVGGSVNINHWKEGMFPVDQFGSQSFGFSYTHIGTATGGMDGMENSSSTLRFAYGRSFNYGRILTGFSIGYNNNSIVDSAAEDLDINAYEVKVGSIVRVTEAFSLGGVLCYGNGDTEGNGSNTSSKGEYQHREIRFGGALQATDVMMFTGDIVFQKFESADKDNSPRAIEEHEVLRLSAGTEYVVMPSYLTVRGGLFYTDDECSFRNIANTSDRNLREFGISGGLSYYKENWMIETGHEIMTNGDHTHNINFTLDF